MRNALVYPGESPRCAYARYHQQNVAIETDDLRSCDRATCCMAELVGRVRYVTAFPGSNYLPQYQRAFRNALQPILCRNITAVAW